MDRRKGDRGVYGKSFPGDDPTAGRCGTVRYGPQTGAEFPGAESQSTWATDRSYMHLTPEMVSRSAMMLLTEQSFL